MERLTERFNNYVGDYVRVKGNKTVYSGEKRKKSYLQNAIIRLSEYEDTCLEPMEVRKISNVFRQISEEYNCWFDFAVKCLLEKAKEIEKNPLTMAELLEMDGYPVWCCNPKDINQGHWAIIRNDKFDGPEYNQCAYAVGICWSFQDYGKTWFAYRRKPE